MNMVQAFSFFVAQAAESAPAGAQQPSALASFLPMICIFVIMYFLMIRPQQQKQKQLQERVNSLQTGDEVVFGGIHGVVANVKDGSTMTVKIADNVRIEVEKTAITAAIKKAEEQKA